MRWWLNTDHQAFSVDNAAVSGLDLSALEPDIWMVQWMDGRGEIERHDVDEDANLNGLRESFIDVIPYAPYFQQFLRLTPGLLLEQAKKIQIELINTIFDSKRQMPFHYTVAVGDYWWDATDTTLRASTANAQWIPIGSTVSVNVTPAEQQAIINGIAARTNQLNLVRNSKNAAVNALTILAAVIDYDVTTGWPATSLPPGFKPYQIMAADNLSSVVFVGTGGTSTGGIPEAPNDGVTYGRRNLVWNPALAKSNDILDGGSF